MRSFPARFAVLASLALAGLVGCATFGPQPEPRTVVFEVSNNVGPPQRLTIWLVPVGHDPIRLGDVPTSETRELPWSVRPRRGYHLDAQPSAPRYRPRPEFAPYGYSPPTVEPSDGFRIRTDTQRVVWEAGMPHVTVVPDG